MGYSPSDRKRVRHALAAEQHAGTPARREIPERFLPACHVQRGHLCTKQGGNHSQAEKFLKETCLAGRFILYFSTS